jgi:ABC-type glycerol-3-phosphate transport system permease component
MARQESGRRVARRAATWRAWRDSSWHAIVAVLVTLAALGPFLWAAIVSVTPESYLYDRQIHYIPPEVTFANFVRVFEAWNFGKAFTNSVIVAVAVTLLSVSLSISAAYAFARMTFVGRRFLIVSLLLIYLLPSVVLLVPLMVIFRTLGMFNTYQALILAESTHALPFAIWLLTNYFASLPRELEEAAQVDGCTRVGALIRVVVPLAIPGIVAAALFVFIASWNEFLFAFMFTSGEDVRTLPVLLRGFIPSETGVSWGIVTAGAVTATLPVAAAFLVFQRFLVRGLASGAVKG